MIGPLEAVDRVSRPRGPTPGGTPDSGPALLCIPIGDLFQRKGAVGERAWRGGRRRARHAILIGKCHTYVHYMDINILCGGGRYVETSYYMAIRFLSSTLRRDEQNKISPMPQESI